MTHLKAALNAPRPVISCSPPPPDLQSRAAEVFLRGEIRRATKAMLASTCDIRRENFTIRHIRQAMEGALLPKFACHHRIWDILRFEAVQLCRLASWDPLAFSIANLALDGEHASPGAQVPVSINARYKKLIEIYREGLRILKGQACSHDAGKAPESDRQAFGSAHAMRYTRAKRTIKPRTFGELLLLAYLAQETLVIGPLTRGVTCPQLARTPSIADLAMELGIEVRDASDLTSWVEAIAVEYVGKKRLGNGDTCPRIVSELEIRQEREIARLQEFAIETQVPRRLKDGMTCAQFMEAHAITDAVLIAMVERRARRHAQGRARE